MKKVAGLLVALLFVMLPLLSGPAAGQSSLDAVLAPYLKQYDLPALAAAVVEQGRIVAAGAVGTRRAGTDIPVTLDDRFHLGSDTKAMTALLAATLVEEGKLRWNSRAVEVFPELSGKMDPGLKRVTLEQLLSHTSGIASDNKNLASLLLKSFSETGNLDELRYGLIKRLARFPLASRPGKTFVYSNMGYTLAGAMIERAGGKSWDELITERVFFPLGLHTSGLGCQVSPGLVDAPLPHLVAGGKTVALLAGPGCDNPPIIGPAGIAHMSILDFARWAGWNAGDGKREPHLVKPQTMQKLHTPVISLPEKKNAPPGTPRQGKYGFGWGEVTVDWAPDPLLYHGGSNVKNLAHIWIDRKRDIAMVTATNIGGQNADEALMKLARELYTTFAP